jgi:ATPase subunit of ABC transporter with duplicated ATPase domains
MLDCVIVAPLDAEVLNMSAPLHARDIAYSIGSTPVLNDVTVSLYPGRRVGVVGANGVGKSTLLRIMAGLLTPEDGTVVTTPADAVVGYLPQEPDRRPGETVLDFLARRTGVAEATARLEAAAEGLAEGAAGADDEYVTALDRWMALGGGELESRSVRVLKSLGIDEALADRPTEVLSGGEAARVSLASILLSRFDVLLLDEPTNDLDFEGLARLEDFATRVEASLAVVSHDRAFLERVVTDVVELDEHSHEASHFAGGWNAYLESRTVARRHAADDYSTYTDKRDTLKGRAQRQRLWSNKGARKAKADTSEKDKHIKARRTEVSQKQASKARATERAIERLEVVDKPWEGWQLQLEIAETGRSGDVVSRLERVVVDRGSFRLGPVDVEINFGDRVAITGPNGSGKSTLLSLLQGTFEPDAGNRYVGPGVIFGELEQSRSRFLGETTLLDGFTESSGILPVDARTILAKFGLSTDHVLRQAALLSPGERTRASLALLQARGVNCLVLDEPTNHLDLPAIEQLEMALDSFAGTILLVSHDRHFLDRFGAARELHLEAGQIVTP